MFGSIKGRKNRCLARLAGIQKVMYETPSFYMFDLEKQLIGELHEILRQEEVYWSQISHINWITQGERNTRYFHATIVMRRKRKAISKLKNGADEWVEIHMILRC